MADRKQAVFRLPVELHDRLTREAAARGLSANLLATKAIADFLDRLIPVDQLTLVRRPTEEADGG